MENFETGVNSSEENENGERPKKPSAWLIDDSQETANLLFAMVKSTSNDNYQLTHFQNAESAIEKFKELCANKDLDLPRLILMDGNLDVDVPEPKIKTGVKAIIRLKEIADEYQVELPEIIAFSNSSQLNTEMIEKGATRAVNKGIYSDLKKFVSEIVEAK